MFEHLFKFVLFGMEDGDDDNNELSQIELK